MYRMGGRRSAAAWALALRLGCLGLAAASPMAAWAQPAPEPIPAGTPAPTAPASDGEVLRPPPAAPAPAPVAPATPAPAPASGAVRDAAPEPKRPEPEQTNVHGIGIAGSFATGSGLTYRRYFGNTSLQLSCLAIITDRGNDAVAFVGGSLVRYVLVWSSPGARGLLPATSALRVVGGAHYYLRRWQENTTVEPTQGVIVPQSEQKRQSSINLGAGLGFEFGGIVKSGFSLSLDLVLTAAIDKDGLDYILPLPQSALVYSW
ncbi:MAG: hypothetical protein FJ100_23025 [Deltaproteobacteria bacterium]|nr:hypothetical protein [Deltaproteobacteria bacterium]